jgi:hypothetical protein
MPGLRSKTFTVAEANRRAMNDELRERVTGLYGVAPTIDYLEIAELVDNTSA